jgi:hypothetical protein
MNERLDDLDSEGTDPGLQLRLAEWFRGEIERAERDYSVAPRVAPQVVARRKFQPRLSGIAALGVVAIAIVTILRVAPVVLPASTSGLAGGIATATPTVTAWYPDGLPSAINGLKVYRPDDIGPQMPSGRFLVGGWDAGPLGMSCPADLIGASSPPCPAYEGLAQQPKGPTILKVMWDSHYDNAEPVVVLTAEIIPLDPCVSTPPGGCPTRPNVHGVSYVWQGVPGP